MNKKISLLRVKVDSVEEFRNKIESINNDHKNIDRFQLCLKSSLLNEEFVDEMLNIGAVGVKYILRLEMDQTVSLDALKRLKDLIYQIVVIAGDKSKVNDLVSVCHCLDIDLKNFLQERKNVFGDECRIKQEKSDYLTERKLIEALSEYSGSTNKDIQMLDDTKEVILIAVEAGLSCQICQYLFALRVAQMTDRKIILDDSGNYVRNSNSGKDKFVNELIWSYKLDKEQAEKCAEEAYKVISHFQFEGLELDYIFDLKLPLLSQYFPADSWNAFIERRSEQKFSFMPEILEEMGYSVSLIRDNNGMEFQNNLVSMVYEASLDDIYLEDSDDERLLKYLMKDNSHNIYLSSLAISGNINNSLFSRRDWAQSNLQFPEITEGVNAKIYEEIGKTNSVIIHVRRGEKVYSSWTLDSGYYKSAISEIENASRDKVKYYLFSDSMDWCRQNESELGLDMIRDRLTYVEGNSGKNSYIDMQLMANGTIMIPSPASFFGICAVLLGKIERCVDRRPFLEKGEIRFVEL